VSRKGRAETGTLGEEGGIDHKMGSPGTLHNEGGGQEKGGGGRGQHLWSSEGGRYGGWLLGRGETLGWGEEGRKGMKKSGRLRRMGVVMWKHRKRTGGKVF